MRPDDRASLAARLTARRGDRQRRRGRLVLVIAAALVCVGATTTETIEPLAAVGRLDYAGHEERFHCTATLIASDRAVTAAHCMDPPATVDNARFQPAFAAQRGAELLRLKAWSTGAGERDVALLCLASEARTVPMPRGVRGVALGEGLTVVGYAIPGERGQTQAGCTVDELGPDGVFLLDCPLRPGTSGAPVVRQTRSGNEIVGIVSATNSKQSLAYDITWNATLPACR